jgi:glycosyltransferase involved in cell wall biosynthesis
MRVLQLIDSLDAGGAERVAVTYANTLCEYIEASFLCATRKEGLLKQTINQKVGYLFLKKKSAIDIKAIVRLVSFIKKNKIDIIHAHTSSFFLATSVKIYLPKIKIIWHDHYGKSEELDKRDFKILKWCSKKFCAIISVNKILEAWAKRELKTDRVYYLENVVLPPPENSKTPLKLKGIDHKRIVCVANFREQKDHGTLLGAFKMVLKKHPEYSLHLVGQHWDDDYFREVSSYMNQEVFRENVFYYGSQSNIYSILKQADIGVLSSNSEGLPLALLEYGMSKLGVVCTDVGQCKYLVKDYGKCVPPKKPEALAEAINFYIDFHQKLEIDSHNFNNHVNKNYSIKINNPNKPNTPCSDKILVISL